MEMTNKLLFLKQSFPDGNAIDMALALLSIAKGFTGPIQLRMILKISEEDAVAICQALVDTEYCDAADGPGQSLRLTARGRQFIAKLQQ